MKYKYMHGNELHKALLECLSKYFTHFRKVCLVGYILFKLVHTIMIHYTNRPYRLRWRMLSRRLYEVVYDGQMVQYFTRRNMTVFENKQWKHKLVFSINTKKVTPETGWIPQDPTLNKYGRGVGGGVRRYLGSQRLLSIQPIIKETRRRHCNKFTFFLILPFSWHFFTI
jgi:hypothetical protein